MYMYLCVEVVGFIKHKQCWMCPRVGLDYSGEEKNQRL